MAKLTFRARREFAPSDRRARHIPDDHKASSYVAPSAHEAAYGLLHGDSMYGISDCDIYADGYDSVTHICASIKLGFAFVAGKNNISFSFSNDAVPTAFVVLDGEAIFLNYDRICKEKEVSEASDNGLTKEQADAINAFIENNPVSHLEKFAVAPPSASWMHCVYRVSEDGLGAVYLDRLSPSDLRKPMKLNKQRYYSTSVQTPDGGAVELQQPIPGKWIVADEFGDTTSVFDSPQAAIAAARDQLGLRIGQSFNFARMFAMHETEAGWPLGWYFDTEVQM